MWRWYFYPHGLYTSGAPLPSSALSLISTLNPMFQNVGSADQSLNSSRHTMIPPSKGLNPSEFPNGKTIRSQFCGPTPTHHLAYPRAQGFILRRKQYHTLQHPCLLLAIAGRNSLFSFLLKRDERGDTTQRQSWNFEVYPLVQFPTG